ncbi:hypothetical protein L0152_18140, partial [bacterium]|nr:hypothetical protein [bacterium]
MKYLTFLLKVLPKAMGMESSTQTTTVPVFRVSGEHGSTSDWKVIRDEANETNVWVELNEVVITAERYQTGDARFARSSDWTSCPSCSTSYTGGWEFRYQGSWVSESEYRNQVRELAQAIAYEDETYYEADHGFSPNSFTPGSFSSEILSE